MGPLQVPIFLFESQEMVLAVTFFAAITDDNLGSLVKKLMKDSMQKYDQNHKDHGVTKGNFFHTFVFSLIIRRALLYFYFLLFHSLFLGLRG